MRYLISFLMLWPSVAGAANPDMFFACHGPIGYDGILLVVEKYEESEWRGIQIRRKGLYDDSSNQIILLHDVVLKTKRDADGQSNQEIIEFEVDKYVKKQIPTYNWETGKKNNLKTDNSIYTFRFPARKELEKIWKSPSDPAENGEFLLTARLTRTAINGKQTSEGKFQCALERFSSGLNLNRIPMWRGI